jgi:pimeloyl-ACP methyl ester carboxylesterase
MVKNSHPMALLFLSLAPLGRVKAADDVFDSNGVKIRYVTEGKGEPIVVLHGWLADSSMWGRPRHSATQSLGPDRTGQDLGGSINRRCGADTLTHWK